MALLCWNRETQHIQRVATHLGHPVGIDNVNSIAIRKATRNVIRRTNYVMAKFVFSSADVLYQLLGITSRAVIVQWRYAFLFYTEKLYQADMEYPR